MGGVHRMAAVWLCSEIKGSHFFLSTSLFYNFFAIIVAQFNHFEVAEFAALYIEAYQRACFMEPVSAGSSGIDMQAVESLVIHHLQDMRVPCDKEAGWAAVYFRYDIRSIMSRVAPYVSHPHVGALDGETQVTRRAQAYLLPVYVAIYGTYRFYRFQIVQHLAAAYVAGMPYFVALGKIFFIPRVAISVSV